MPDMPTPQPSLPTVDPVQNATAAQSMPLPAYQQPTAQPAQQQSLKAQVSASMPMQAADLELIEKEWVEKAKLIVYRTHGDPYMQSKALGEAKADYIRKRYGKDIKTSE